VWILRVWLQDLVRVSPAERRGHILASEAVTPWVSVEACEGATSMCDGGKDDWRHAIEGLLDSYDRVRVTSQFRVTLRHVIRVNLQLRQLDNSQVQLEHGPTIAKFDGTHEKRGVS
jgi:hypothetical protein